MRWFFDPVVGDALRAVGYRDRAALAESEGRERAPHRCVVLVGVAAQVVSVLSREAENRSCDPMPTHCGYTVNHVVVGVGMPSTVNLCIGFVRARSKGKDCERPLVVGHEETVFACDVFLSINAARVSVWPLCRVPIRLHERPSMLIRARDELEVVGRSKSNLHITRIGGVGSARVATYWG